MKAFSYRLTFHNQSHQEPRQINFDFVSSKKYSNFIVLGFTVIYILQIKTM